MDIINAENYMREALLEAEAAFLEAEIPVGAVIVYDGKIIAQAHNRCEASRDPTAHAEMLVISQASQKLGGRSMGAVLFSTLEPCPMCAGAVIGAKIDRVYFGAYDRQYGCCGSVYRLTEDPAFNHFAQTTGGILQTECEAIISRHFQKIRRISKNDKSKY